MFTKTILAAGVLTLTATLAVANPVQFDISSAYNYDAFGTSLEVGANVPVNGNFLFDSIGDHSINGNRRAYANQGSVANGTAAPDNGQVGPYQTATNFDNGTDGLAKVDNAVAIQTNNAGTIFSVTITLPVAQQGLYQSMNMLMVSRRDADHTSYRSWIEANYTDATSAVIVDTGDNGDQGNTGTFGLSNLEKTADSTTFVNQAPGTGQTIGVSPVLTMDRLLSQGGSTQSIRNGTATMWEFDQAIGLDPTRTLESFTVNLQRSGVNRNHSLFILAMNGQPVPEPASAAMIGLAGLMMIARRRR